MTRDTAIVAKERQQEVIYDLDNGAIFDYIEWLPNPGFKVTAVFNGEYLKKD